MRDPGLERSDPRRRRRQRTRAPHRHLAAVGFELGPHSRRARAHRRGRDRRQPRDPAARSVRRPMPAATSTRSMPRARRNTRCSPRCWRARPTPRCSSSSRALRGDATPLGVAHAALARGRQRDQRRARRARILRPVHRARPRRAAALRLVLSHRLPARAAAGAAARRSRARSASSASKARSSRRITPRSCARSWRAWRRGASARRPAPTSRSSRSIWRPGSALLRRSRARRGGEILPPRRHARPRVHRHRDGGVRAAVVRRRATTNIEEETAMKTERKTTVGRREFLRALGAGAGVAATAAAPLATVRQGRHREQR